MPFKLNQDRRHHIPRQQRKVTNWPVYEASLRQRGSLTVWFSEEAVAAWVAAPRTTRGGQPWYSPLAILTALTLRAVFHLAYRQTEGLIGSILSLLGLTLQVPDHTTLSRRSEVDPVWWSPPHFRRRLPTWPKPARLTRLNFVDRWSNWSAPAAIRMILRVSSNRPRSRSATGSAWPIERDGRREEKVEVVTPTERDELIRLRRENKQLRQERDILSRAAAWFARETGAVPSGSSNS